MNLFESMKEINKKSQITSLEYQTFLESHKEKIKEFVQIGETFLREQLSNEEGISTIRNKQMKLILEKFDIEIQEMDNLPKSKFLLLKHEKILESDEEKKYRYVYFIPSDEELISKLGLAYVLGLIIFKSHEKNSECNQVYSFTVPSGCLSEFSMFEKAFIYSLIIPFSQYKKLFTKFLQRDFDEKYSWEWAERNDIYEFVSESDWLNFLSGHLGVTFRITTIINEFYVNFFADDLNKIYGSLELEIENSKKQDLKDILDIRSDIHASRRRYFK